MTTVELIMFIVLALLVAAACWGVIAKVCVGDSIVSTALAAIMVAVGLFLVYAAATSF
jgi:hypothetical protein